MVLKFSISIVHEEAVLVITRNNIVPITAVGVGDGATVGVGEGEGVGATVVVGVARLNLTPLFQTNCLFFLAQVKRKPFEI